LVVAPGGRACAYLASWSEIVDFETTHLLLPDKAFLIEIQEAAI
jgi:hypothetical protein